MRQDNTPLTLFDKVCIAVFLSIMLAMTVSPFFKSSVKTPEPSSYGE